MTFALAIETAGRLGSLALARDGKVVGEDVFPHGLKHAAEIITRIDRLCVEHGATPADIGEIYVSTGPGSFTGLRIGITVAKTLAFSTGADLIEVPSLPVLAENAPAEARHLILVLDAKRDQVFTARYARDAESRWVEQEPAHLDDLPSMLARSPRPVYLLGEGIPFHRKFIPDSEDVVVTTEESWRARAVVVAEQGMRLAIDGYLTEPDRLLPLYIRRPEAEEKRLAAEAAATSSPSPGTT